jgi:hypothetical protein
MWEKKRPCRGRRPAFGAVLALVLALVASASPTPDDPGRSLREALGELHGLRAELRAEEVRHREASERLLALTVRLAADRTELEPALEGIVAEEGRLRAELSRVESGSLEAGRLLTGLAAGLDAFVDQESTRVASGISLERERRQGVLREVVRLLASATPDDKALGLETLAGFVREELHLAGTCDARSTRVELPDGRELDARIVRIGLVTELFRAVEEDVQGELVAGEWHLQEEGRESSVTTLLDILDRRRSSRLVEVSLRVAGGAR